ncbi:MAG: rRNA maturation RNase YbeY [Clostridiales bacterium]|jgi:probable rRNA maturation factor|nr:rRNA maturation RNase YbeY [Clostridiales bacterium]
MIDISINAELNGISEDEAIRLLNEICTATLVFEQRSGNVGVSIVDDAVIQRINAEFREKNQATDVLSFPSYDGSSYDVTDAYLGDIAISIDRAVAQAKEYGHSLQRELAFLAVHGMLHLLGYDHEAGDAQKGESIMFSKQEEILTNLGYKR